MGALVAIVDDINGDGVDELVVGAYAAKNSDAFPTGKIYIYYGVDEGGCRPAVELTKTVGLADFPAIYTNTSVITVPTDAVIRFNYTVTNTGNVTLTQHLVVDDKVGVVTETAYMLALGANFSVNVTSTPGVSVTPGITITNVATWTGAIPITSPSGVTTPTNRMLSASAVASAQVNISGPTTDQDGDGIPDNVEGSGDPDGDKIPNYLDLNSDGDEYDDAVEAGPDPTNPIDRNGNQIPAYLDPDENPDTEFNEPIAGLALVGPSQTFAGEAVNFTAIITSGNNVTFTWTFGDSGAATGQIAVHTYTTPGPYVVAVTATNPLGQQQVEKSIEVLHSMNLPRILTTGVQN